MPPAVARRLLFVSGVLSLGVLLSLVTDRSTYPLVPAATQTVESTLASRWSPMVLLYADRPGGGASCSGFLVSETLVATAAHCIEGAIEIRVQPAAYRDAAGMKAPLGECRSHTPLIAPGYALDPLGQDYAAFHIENCDSTSMNPSALKEVGVLTGYYALTHLPTRTLEGLPVTAAGYPESLEPGELQLSRGTVRRLGCELRRSWMCPHRWNITTAMRTPPGHSGGVLLREGSLEAVALLDAWSPERNESVFRRIDQDVLQQFLAWGAAPSPSLVRLTSPDSPAH